MANTVSFQVPTDYSVEAADIDRRRKYAELLQQQALQPIPMPQTPAGGFTPQISWTQGLAKALQGYNASKGMEKASEDAKALAAQRQAALAQAIQGYDASKNGTPAQTVQQPVDTSQEGTGSMDMSGTAGPPTQPVQQAAVPGNPRAAAMAAMVSQYPEMQAVGKLDYAQLAKQDAPYNLKEGETRFGAGNQPVANIPTKPVQVTAAGANGAPETRFVRPDVNAAPIPMPVKMDMANTGGEITPLNPYTQKEPVAKTVDPNTQFRVENRVITDTAKYSNVQPDGKGGFMGLSKATGQMEHIPSAEGVVAPGVLSGDALEAAAERYLIDRSLPTNLGRGNQGGATTTRILDRAAALAKERGDSAEATAIGQVSSRAKIGALNQNTKDLSAIRPYNEMLDRNGNIAIQAAEKVSRTSSQLANKTINWLAQNASDNPDVAVLLAQTRILSTEAARVLNNPRLTGELSDTARKDMDMVVNGNMPINAYSAVVRRMQADGKIRVGEIVNEAERLKKEIGRRASDKPDASVLKFDAQGNLVK